MFQGWWPAVAAAALVAGLMPLAIRSQRLGRDDDFKGVQKAHNVSTSRLGGVIVFVAYLAVLAVATRMGDAALSPTLPLLLCSLPVVLVGLWEDITQGVHPWHRLAGAVASAALASAFAFGTIARLDLPFLDDWLKYLLFALPLTWFMVAGACNAMNLIDGAHGLAGGTALMMFGGLAGAAAIVDDPEVLAQSLVMMGAITGFLVWNYPRGLIFAGDGGAYLWGAVIAVVCVLLVLRHPQVSPWFPMLLLIYPVWETAFSIYRKIARGQSPGLADALHFHQLIHRRIVRQVFDDDEVRGMLMRNNRTSPYLWGFAMLTVLPAVLFWNQTPLLMLFVLIFIVSYVWAYTRIIRFKVPRWLRR